ncbi:hypothetical protein BX600DRAFT_444347 [Xylariales sp. PMI_506]|nr:hypothetical protein BX600DRAFT_444347 [Xylariales sp. PMI_506]
MLQGDGFITRVGRTRTTNSKPPGNPTVTDNVDQCREDISRFVEEAGEEQVVVAMHSAAGVFCCGALKGLSVEQRKAANKTGGIAHLIFIAANVAEEGDLNETTRGTMSIETLEAAGLVSVSDGQIFPNNVLGTMFQDLSPDEAQRWAGKVGPEPAQLYGEPIEYMGWRNIASHYILCENDQFIPAQFQEQYVKLAGSTAIRMDTGHFPMLSKPAQLVQVIKQVVADM